ncbi:16S rRNA (guanine(527)-N(7))-methyltransferase RsmG [Candidatus Cyanaurora vandensis]|uniref:16S rRNA (guanine(527)-N(7))-methyltransferase RsmG n=1 Tax=Candidatus Cyanaurora vandensis TaxID=2714958 RepID=UPI00257F01D3|nr:16S rRNA (guanine(527)-N(7))-methyltransferase RsmG [Candidatus Cyanaurora vandensis]
MKSVLPHDRWADTLGWEPDSQVRRQFDLLYAQVLKGNAQQNLTRITEPAEFWEKHLWDSLRNYWPHRDRPEQVVIDIGSGAGFPGLPVALVQPDWVVVLLEATKKKAAFLASCVQQLGLTNVQILAQRAEILGHHRDHRAGYDLALVRAVAPVTVCAEYALPLLKVGGMALLYQGQWEIREEVELNRAVQVLGGEISDVDAFNLPLTQAVRHCIVITKKRPTLQVFPRDDGIPMKHPLGLLED